MRPTTRFSVVVDVVFLYCYCDESEWLKKRERAKVGAKKVSNQSELIAISVANKIKHHDVSIVAAGFETVPNRLRMCSVSCSTCLLTFNIQFNAVHIARAIWLKAQQP